MATPKKSSAPRKKITKAASAPKAKAKVKAKAKTGASKRNFRAVTLTLKGAPGQSVFLAGSFNNWERTSHPMAEQDGIYTATLKLEDGVYEYKFLVNDVWTLDPDPTCDWTQNAFGTLNSLLRVGE